MFRPDRFRERIKKVGISQAELARRVGVTQKTINKLALGQAAGSKHLHRIARELGTSIAYLEGETDQPDADVGSFGVARPSDQLTLTVELPPHDELARSLELTLGELSDLSDAQRAQELARRMPGLMETRLAYRPKEPPED